MPSATRFPRGPHSPRSPAALAELRSRGWRIALLSNTDPDFLAASLVAIGVPVDLDDHGRRGRLVQAGARALGERSSRRPTPTGPECTCESAFHDIAPAHELGILAVWINRLGESQDQPRAAELPDSSKLPAMLEALVPARPPVDKTRSARAFA